MQTAESNTEKAIDITIFKKYLYYTAASGTILFNNR